MTSQYKNTQFYIDHFCDWVGKYIEDKKINQRYLAGMLGIESSIVSTWVGKRRNPTLPQVIQTCLVLNVDLATVLGLNIKGGDTLWASLSATSPKETLTSLELGFDAVASMLEKRSDFDPRWFATGKTDIQKGLMCWRRALQEKE